jgi:hypothetical protein
MTEADIVERFRKYMRPFDSNQQECLAMPPAKSMRQKASLAMPMVKECVKSHGLDVVAYCITRLKANEKQIRKIESLKREISALEKQIP